VTLTVTDYDIKSNRGDIMFFSRPVGLTYDDRGDVESEDFSVGDLTKDDNWHDLDLSGIIAVNTKLVILKVYGATSANKGYIYFKTKGHTTGKNRHGLCINVVGAAYITSFAIHPDANGKVQYNVLSTATYSALDITVCSWVK